MRLIHISIENFKGIRDRVEIPLRPITLLFGANSAGKSTILQALLYLRELLEHQNADADFLSASGAAIHLGGFRQMVHGHDLSKEIKIGVTVALDDDGLPGHSENGDSDSEIAELHRGISALREIKVEVTVEWRAQENGPALSAYRVDGDGQPVLKILHQRLDHPKLWLNSDHPSVHEVLQGAWGVPFSLPEKDLAERPTVVLVQDTVIPNWHTEVNGGFESSEAESEFPKVWHIQEMITRLAQGAGCAVLSMLKHIRYIGPIREFPERGALPQRSRADSRWASGLAAWDWLGKDSTDSTHLTDLEDFRDLISEKSGLDLGYSVDVVGSRRILDDSLFHEQLIALRYSSEPEEELDRLKQLIEETYLNLPVERRVVITDLRNGAEVSPQDVGNGVTQVIPVVAGVVAPGAPILAVEQPELHLHPAIQCRLADVFVRAVRGGGDRLFLLESHSEHLMLRLMRRIRETGEGESPEAHLTLRPDDLSVVYVEAIPEGVKMTVLPLTEDGDFSRNWPAGFFEDRAAELF